jgi:hypothetical protein
MLLSAPCRISQALYDSILPLVKTQVESQIKVRDLSRCSVSVSPAEFGTWSQARSELLLEAKRPLKAQLQAELAAAADETAAEEIRAAFQAREKALEHDIDHKPMEVHLEMGISYSALAPLARFAMPLRFSPVFLPSTDFLSK